MRLLGIRCTKDSINWAVIEGNDRGDAKIVDFDEASAPSGPRAEQLAWARKEILELTNRLAPISAALRAAEAGQNVSASLARAEMDGVIQASLAEAEIDVKRMVGASVRAAFSAKTTVALENAIALVPCVSGAAKVRRDQIVVAVSQLPA
jgi:Holliday junction resolvasome RuvABC endonuclease subunit